MKTPAEASIRRPSAADTSGSPLPGIEDDDISTRPMICDEPYFCHCLGPETD
jgi:hypothetical protein